MCFFGALKNHKRPFRSFKCFFGCFFLGFFKQIRVYGYCFFNGTSHSVKSEVSWFDVIEKVAIVIVGEVRHVVQVGCFVMVSFLIHKRCQIGFPKREGDVCCLSFLVELPMSGVC